jgi:hypothetical protein
MNTVIPVVAPVTPAPPKPVRHMHWATRSLHKHLVATRALPFKWGTHDCALFAANAIESMTGVDIASDFRGLYHDEAGAKAAIEKVTGVVNGTVEDAAAYCAAKHGLVELVHPLTARRGDLVVLEDSGRVIAGLVHLSGREIVSAGEKGLKKISIMNIKRAWRI